MDPVSALRQIAYYKDRDRQESRRVMAYRKAADILEGLDEAALERHGQANSWQSIPGIGPKTALVIAQAWAGQEPDQLVELRSNAKDLGGAEVRTALRGDLHLHSNWSDGSAPIEEMMATAAALGHEYCALTDHSPRLTIANGLSPDRLRKQLDVIDELREKFAPLRILTGIEVDILEDGTLDQEPELLDRLDIVVASVHSKLAMEPAAMTRRMVRAVSDGHADVLGHCTGRLVSGNRGIRAESTFDAERCSPPAATTAPRWRSTPGPSAATRRPDCSTSRKTSAASSASTPTRTRRASWTSSATARSGRWTRRFRSTALSTPGPSRSCWTGQSGSCGISSPGSRPTNTARVSADLP